MKHLATTPHEGNPQEAARNLFELEDGDEQFGSVGACYDNLSGEVLDRETVQQNVDQLEAYAQTLRDYLLRTCGAHPLLVDLRLNGFELPECDGGWYFCSGTPTFSLGQGSRGDGEWTLSVEARYEHDDDRGR